MKKLLIGALVGAAVVAAVRKCAMVRHLSGKSEAEIRDAIIAKATPRVGAEKANEIADRIVARLAARGLLASETATA